MPSPPSGGARGRTLAVRVDGEPAHLVQDDQLLYLVRGPADPDTNTLWTQELAARIDVVVPHILVLNTSVVPDPAGATLVIRLLTPAAGSPKVKSWSDERLFPAPAGPAPAPPQATFDTPLFTGGDKLQALLEGPFADIKLSSITARVAQEAVPEATQWAETCFARAYASPLTGHKIHPFRKMRVLVNPHAGKGHAEKIWREQIQPILEAAGCFLSTTLTTHRNHGLEIVHHEPDLADRFDCIVYLSGDGMLHEVLNGFASRPDARTVLDKIAVVPIPAGSGNACSVNLLGPQQGFNFALAALNAVKGHWLDLEICTITQPASCLTQESHLNEMFKLMKACADESGCQTTSDQESGFVRYYSFLSQTIGLMADLDIGTEHLRMLGDLRFVLGYLNGVLWNSEAHVTLDIKLGKTGTTSRGEMRRRVMEHQAHTRTEGPGSQELTREEELEASRGLTDPALERPRQGMPPLRNGSAIDDLGGENLPDFDMYDPSWPKSYFLKTIHYRPPQRAEQDKETQPAADGWARVRHPLMSMYSGKLPYVARDLLQFPNAIAGDGLVDLAFMVQDTRWSKLRALQGAETGGVIYDDAISYVKAEAFRVTPHFPRGSAVLRKGGIISIDGERVPYAPFQVEITKGTQLRTYSIYGNFVMKHHFPAF